MKIKNRIISIIILSTVIFWCVPNLGGMVYAKKKIQISNKRISLYIGKSKILRLKGTRKKAKWYTSNKKIATVSKKGKVLARKKGTVVIKAKLGRKIYRCRVYVKNKNNRVLYDKKLVKSKLQNEKDYEVVEENNEKISVTIPTDVNTETIKNGDVIMLPANQENKYGMALKVDSVSENNENFIIEGESPKAEEVFDCIDIGKTISADSGDFEVNEDIVDSVDIENQTNITNRNNRYHSTGINIKRKFGKKRTLYLKNVEIGDNGKISGSISLDATILTALINVNFNSLKKSVVKIDVENKVTMNTNIKLESGINPIYLASIHGVSLGNGFFVDIVFNLCVEANGEATVKSTVVNNTGFNYTQSAGVKPYSTFKRTFKCSKTKIDAKLLLNPLAKLRWGGIWIKDQHKSLAAIQIIGFGIKLGPGICATITNHDARPFTCVSMDLYAYLSLDLVTDCGIGSILNNAGCRTSWILIDKDKNSIRNKYHYEDGNRVNECYYLVKIRRSNSVWKIGNTAYCLTNWNKIYSVNIKTKKKSVFYTVDGGILRDIIIHNGYIYVTRGANGLITKICRLNIKTKKFEEINTLNGIYGYALKNGKLFYLSPYFDPNVKDELFEISMDGLNEKKSNMEYKIIESNTNNKNYKIKMVGVWQNKNKSNVEYKGTKYYLETPKGTIYLCFVPGI